MFDRIEILRQAQAMAAHAGARQELAARNVAHADTPGFRPSDLTPFADAYRGAGSQDLRQTRAGHLPGALGPPGLRPVDATDAATALSPNGNAVSLEREMIRGAEIRAQHDMALAIYQTALGVLRSSLGRR